MTRTPVVVALAVVGCGLAAGCSGKSEPVVTQPAAVTVTATPTQARTGGTTTAAAASAPAPAQAATPAAASSRDASVVALQQALKQMNYDVVVTGVNDAQTQAAVKRFQANHGLTVDGVAGGQTWSAIQQAQADWAARNSAPTMGAAPSGGGGAAAQAGSNYTSSDPVCVSLESAWQDAVKANSHSRTQSLHDQAAARGCKPDLWYPEGKKMRRVNESHVNGESCTHAQLGTVATGTYPNLLCSEVSDGVYQWVQGDY